MRVDWRQELEGYSLLQIRNVLRKLPYSDTTFTARFVSKALPRGIPLASANRLIDGLIESGLVEISGEPDSSRTQFVLTDTGISLRAANATKRFKRERADEGVAKLLGVVAQINADPIFPWGVESVAVFGSYITDEPDLGDVDVAVQLRARWKPHPGLLGSKKSERELLTEIFEAKYPPPASFYEKGMWRSWPETYTRRLLRTDPGIKIIERKELENIGCPFRQIFPELADAPPKPDWSFQRGDIVLKRAEKSHAAL